MDLAVHVAGARVTLRSPHDAIGAGIGALVAAAGHDVLLIARGAHGAAMRRHGVDLRLPTPPPEGHAWIAAYRRWQEGR